MCTALQSRLGTRILFSAFMENFIHLPFERGHGDVMTLISKFPVSRRRL